mgnify:CR=1 FL=1
MDQAFFMAAKLAISRIPEEPPYVLPSCVVCSCCMSCRARVVVCRADVESLVCGDNDRIDIPDVKRLNASYEPQPKGGCCS